eukprot:TRINITY_DN7837_c0_g1_i4.p1 TRINITY_DN7837_c0_g1~~TRINITY_DN7837_c0_g1_i4.p1  ORF type:complete len:555 (-),score=113.78 TRINITY_DN7837_c0_g1_i4:395-2059(-)
MVVPCSMVPNHEISEFVHELVQTHGPSNLSKKRVRDKLEGRFSISKMDVPKQYVNDLIDQALLRYASQASPACSPALTPAPSASQIPPAQASKPIQEDLSVPGQSASGGIFEGIGKILIEPTQFNQLVVREMKQIISNLGGELCHDVSAATYVVVLYKTGEPYNQALAQGKFITTYFWVHECQRTGRVLTEADNPLCRPGIQSGIQELREAVMSCTGFTDNTAVTHSDVEDLVQVVGATFSGTLDRTRTTHLIVHNHDSRKYRQALEWKEPGLHLVTYHWLKDSHLAGKKMPEAEYQLQMDLTTMDAFMSQQSLEHQESALAPPLKKQKTAPNIHAPCRFLFTGVTKKDRGELTKIVTRLGGELCDEGAEAEPTHIVVGALKRTEKVLFGCLVGVWFVRPEWLVASANAGTWLDPEPYEVHSDGYQVKSGQKQIKMDVLRSWRQLRQNQRREPFDGWRVSVLGAELKALGRVGVLRKLIQGGGGELIEFDPETVGTLTLLVLGEDVDIMHDSYCELVKTLVASGIPCVRDRFVCDFIFLGLPLSEAWSATNSLL